MIATVKVAEKSFGTESLYHNLQFSIQKGEKVAVIGRNGVGKSTLFHIMSGADREFDGELIFKRGTRVAATKQEHHDVAELTAAQYILQELPEYNHLKHIIETYPSHMGSDANKIARYSDAIERFAELGFYYVEDEIRTTLADYQLGDKADAKISTLSGGERRFVELVKLAHMNADLLLIDEPTNHMDYIAKKRFIEWFKRANQAIMVITHDRDLLAHVDRVVEIVDGEARSFPGNYDAYLRQNSQATVSEIHSYETALRALQNIDKQLAWARARKPGWHGKAKRNPFVVMENRLLKQRKAIEDVLSKPSFWVDKESLDQLDDKVLEKYERYKAKNIRVSTATNKAKAYRTLVEASDVSLGYQEPLFKHCSFAIKEGERLELRGRNGAGKSTLINAIVATAHGSKPLSTIFEGEITIAKQCVVGRYEQEIDAKYLQLTLGEAIDAVYHDMGLPCSQEHIMQLLSDYLFDPHQDQHRQVATLSGGQKARLQIIRMLARKPNLLILDEPTNHLDLPSIEELENSLATYDGAVIYVSHDSYFQDHIGGEIIRIGAATDRMRSL